MFLIFDLFYPEAVENWRKEKLEEVKLVSMGGISNSTVSREEAGMSMDNFLFFAVLLMLS
jgi:hypothetical protein